MNDKASREVHKECTHGYDIRATCVHCLLKQRDELLEVLQRALPEISVYGGAEMLAEARNAIANAKD